MKMLTEKIINFPWKRCFEPPSTRMIDWYIICSFLPCQDIDDAVHVREVEDGRYHLGIHIADVSYFVKKGEEIDLEARKRICTAYHGDRSVGE